MSNICVQQGGASDRLEHIRKLLAKHEIKLEGDESEVWAAIFDLYKYGVEGEREMAGRLASNRQNSELRRALIAAARALKEGNDVGGIIASALANILEAIS